MYPSVPFVMRTIEQNVQIDQYHIPAGSHIILHIYGIHNCPEYYPDPRVFQPNRFLPENCIGRHPYSYIPFSAGPRNCIGQKFAMCEEKTILASVIKRYKVTAMEKIEDIKKTEFDDYLDDGCRNMWFQQDGAFVHNVRNAREILIEEFGTKWIENGGPINVRNAREILIEEFGTKWIENGGPIN
ncbi:Cytochrome P450 [Popillia japonica]|uniref:Cytochrome P450 n=1 Tax=Popillia japonica TaxID=7064 RepID=A0AAW1MF81_POPJA